MQDFPKASAERRGCGERNTGLYAECGVSRYGSPLEVFLIDPVIPPPPGLDAQSLANKALVWVDSRRNRAHLISWVGKDYPHAWDILKEGKDMGFSRHISSNTPNLQLLVPGESKLILIHPHSLDPRWQDSPLLDICEKQIPRHDLVQLSREPTEIQRDPTRREGPCLYQLMSLIPKEAGVPLGEKDGRPLYGRTIGSTCYTYAPSPDGRTDSECLPGRIAVLPLTGFCFAQGKKKDPDLEASLKRARSRLQEAEFPMYDLDISGE